MGELLAPIGSSECRQVTAQGGPGMGTSEAFRGESLQLENSGAKAIHVGRVWTTVQGSRRVGDVLRVAGGRCLCGER